MAISSNRKKRKAMKKEGAEFDRGDLARHISDQSIKADSEGEQYLLFDELDALFVLEKAASGIADALAEFNRVEYHDLGVFALEGRPERAGIDPQGNPWQTPAGVRVVFRPSAALLRIIAERTGQPAY